MIETLKALCTLNGVSSREEEVRDYILTRIRPHADAVQVDALGNIIAEKRGATRAAKRLMICAHMDEVGLMVHHATDDGYIKFVTVGGIDRRVLVGKPVSLGDGRIPGVIGLKPVHLSTIDERKTLPKLQDLYIDIGEKDREAAETRCPPGTPIAFLSDCVEFGDGMLKAKAIDDRIGCAVMIHLMESDLPIDCTFVFTAQEEVGCRGAFGSAFSVTPDIALVLEGTTAADNPMCSGHRRVCTAGGGPVIPFMDGGTIYDRALFEQLRDLAEQNEIPWQTKTFVSGGTDAAAIQRSKEGVRVCAISAAVRYLHAPSSVVCLRDMTDMYTLSRLFIESLVEETV